MKKKIGLFDLLTIVAIVVSYVGCFYVRELRLTRNERLKNHKITCELIDSGAEDHLIVNYTNLDY